MHHVVLRVEAGRDVVLDRINRRLPVVLEEQSLQACVPDFVDELGGDVERVGTLPSSSFPWSRCGAAIPAPCTHQ
eukprot:1758561-Heterocapsa_arctica.AAC.1